MPVYEYACEKCKHESRWSSGISDRPGPHLPEVPRAQGQAPDLAHLVRAQRQRLVLGPVRPPGAKKDGESKPAESGDKPRERREDRDEVRREVRDEVGEQARASPRAKQEQEAEGRVISVGDRC
jgi:hypothetical protein